MGKRRHPEGPRKAAWRILCLWDSGSEALESIRDSHFAAAAHDRRDRALITQLTQGVVRHLLFLDHAIREHLDDPDRPVPAPVSWALRIGAYQLLHLDRIPDHAAVAESVHIVKGSRHSRLAPFTNAILRRISEKGAPSIPEFGQDPVRHMELSTSTPTWLVKALMEQEGAEEARLILRSLNVPAPLVLRTNTLVTDRDHLLAELAVSGIKASPGKLAGTGVVIEGGVPPSTIGALMEGRCTVQDEGAQLIAPLLAPAPGQRVLDACAAPGGKTGHLAQLMEDRGFILAVDRSLPRVKMMKEGLKRLGITSVRCLAADLDASATSLVQEAFELILLDAPCSGTGVLRRHPEGKWKKDPDTIRELREVQAGLLSAALPALVRRGRILYTTCSLLREENEEVVDRFLSEHAGVSRVRLSGASTSFAGDVITGRGELRLWPHRHGCDGFYACLLERKK